MGTLAYELSPPENYESNERKKVSRTWGERRENETVLYGLLRAGILFHAGRGAPEIATLGPRRGGWESAKHPNGTHEVRL
jgi:hypothetical protein